MIPYASPLNVLTTYFKFVRSRCQSCRQRRGTLFSAVTLTLFGCVSGGCNQKALVFPDEMCKVDINFLWDKAEGANPEGMTLLFYPEGEKEEFWRFEVSGREGGPVEIPRGRYTMVAVNNDLPGVLLKDMPYSSASLTAMDLPRSQTYASQVGIVYEGKVEHLSVVPGEVSYGARDGERVSSSLPVVGCYPDSISTVYNVVINGVEGIERVKSVEGIFEGCAKGILISSQEPLEPTVATRFVLEIDTEESRVCGVTTGFPNDASSAIYSLTLRVAYYAGGGYEKSFDVTEQVINSFYRHNVYIIIKGLTLPEEPTIEPDEVGMRVDVEGWKVIEVDLDSENY
ncbi:MAG: DUF5119 domain-containing protein [Muribaculaceae bacterium]|nr:DUF5119 domain-containing protein [Muribaculaceae bacterium]